MIKLFVDFNNADSYGRIRLNNQGTIEDIKHTKIVLRRDLKVLLDDSEGLSVVGCVEFSTEENIWVAKINWNDIKNHAKT